MRTIFKVAAVFIGTIVGAGLASGQEILLFFTKYGRWSFLGLILCCILYILLSYIIIKMCYKHHFDSYRDMIRFVFGNHMGRIVDYLTTFFLFSGNVVMISGSGAMLHEYFNVPRLFGILLMSIIAFLIILTSTKGLIAVNSIIVPCSSTIILILGILVYFSFKSEHFSTLNFPETSSSNLTWLFSSVLYASFNLLTVTGVLCPMTKEIKNPKAFIKGAILGSLVLLLLALSINFTILYYYPDSFQYEIPNLYAARFYGFLLSIFLSIIIWLEMLSTEIGELYSLAKAIQSSMHISYIKAIASIMILSLPLTFIGFSNLISFLYPLSGVLGVVFLIGCIYKYISK